MNLQGLHHSWLHETLKNRACCTPAVDSLCVEDVLCIDLATVMPPFTDFAPGYQGREYPSNRCAAWCFLLFLLTSQLNKTNLAI